MKSENGYFISVFLVSAVCFGKIDQISDILKVYNCKHLSGRYEGCVDVYKGRKINKEKKLFSVYFIEIIYKC